MTSSKDIQNEKAERELHKNTQKVLAALQDNPLGLSGNQLTTICRLSIKTVRNIIATRTDITDDLGVYVLNHQQPVHAPDEQKSQQVTEAKASATKKAVIEASSTSTDQQPSLSTPKRNLQAELLQLLHASKEGMLSGEIIKKLGITKKQFNQTMWLLRKSHNIKRLGEIGESLYQLLDGEPAAEVETVEQPIADKPAAQKICAPSLEFLQIDTPSSNEQPAPLTHVLGIEILPAEVIDTAEQIDAPASLLDGFKSQIETVVTRKSKLKLEAAQVSELLSDIFGLSKVDWFIEGGNLVGVLMSDEEKMVA